MTEFKVGDKVTHPHYDEMGEIKYGPYQKAGTYLTGYYLVDFGDDTCRELRGACLSAIPEPPKFAVGDKVTPHDGTPGRIVAGPFVSRGWSGEFWVVEGDDAKHNTHGTDYLTKVVDPEPIKVGDRVRVVRAKYAEERHGQVGTVTSTTEDYRAWCGDPHKYDVKFTDGNSVYAAEVERVTDENAYEYSGVVYDLTAKYRDREGDVWRFARVDGAVRGTCDEDGEARVRSYHATLERVVQDWAPLTRVTD